MHEEHVLFTLESQMQEEHLPATLESQMRKDHAPFCNGFSFFCGSNDNSDEIQYQSSTNEQDDGLQYQSSTNEQDDEFWNSIFASDDGAYPEIKSNELFCWE
ncbi:hypothetical protein PTKIN_Ptkin12aG0159000 [Pterospermum kingtungense]